MIEELKYYAILIAFATCITITILAWPISEIIIGIYYKDNLICPSRDPELTLYKWLIVKGTVTISTIGLLTFFTITVKNTFSEILIKFILNVSNIFNLCWIIFGSYIFWGHCSDLTPNNINIYMWFSLILSYLFILNSAGFQKSVSEKKSKTPLLDIA